MSDAAKVRLDDAGSDRSRDLVETRMPTPLLLTLALLAALSPLATDMYLPGFPTMTGDLATTASGVQLTLTAFLVGLALGQLVFGPLSDRFGRRGPLLLSSAICVLASVAAAVAPNLPLLVAARLVQGLAGAGGVVIGRAVIADLFVGAAAARAFTLMMTVGGIAPILAPFLGSLLVGPIGWRGILWTLAGACVVMVAAILVAVPETRSAAARAEPAPYAAGFRAVAGSHEFRWYGAVFMLVFGMMMAYISASPFIYQEIMGLSALTYGVMFGVNAGGMVLLGWGVSHVVGKVAPQRVVAVSLAAQLVACMAFVVLVLAHAPSWTYAIPIFVAVVFVGGVMGTTTGLAMSAVRSMAGTASAVMGAGQYLLGAALSPLVGLGGTGSALAPALVMTLTCLLANLAARRAARS